MVHKIGQNKDKEEEIIVLEIMPMKEYQRQAELRHSEAVEEWRKGKRSTYPSILFYKFYTPQGNERKKGFVVKYKYRSSGIVGYDVFKTKKEALKKFGSGWFD